MKLIKFNPDNKPFYSTEFIKGFEIGARRQFEADSSAERKGKWIRTGTDGYCSVCQCDMPIFHEDWDLKFCETNFCPNCGADMRGEGRGDRGNDTRRI